jgi:cytochrome b subunit of formate dehydrogenase
MDINSQVPQVPQNGKKPITRKWWFWTAIVIVVLIIISTLYQY